MPIGSATITVTVNDGGASNNIVSRTFTVTVNPVNQPPTLNALANVTINESAGLQTVNLSGITSGATNEVQTLTVTASSSNTGLIPTPTVNYTSPNTTGSITFTPVAYAYGSATITVTVNDGGASNNIVSRTFTVTVNPVNQPPTLNALANMTINENAGLQTVNLSGITSGATNEIQTLTVTASSSNTGLIPTPTVTYTSPNTTGSITFTPVAYAFGSATITVTVNDGGASNNVVSRTFTVTVNPVNQPPTLNALANVTINENAGLQTVNLSGITSGATNEAQTLTVTASSSNTGLIPTPTVNYTSPNTTGSITFTPVANAYGSATITVTVNDGGASNNIVSRTFTVTVNPVNQPPTLNPLANMTLNENAGQQTVNLSGITSGATNENPDAHGHRLFEQHGSDPDSHGHLHQPQYHRLDSGSPRSPMRTALRRSPSRSTMAARAITSSPTPSRSPSTRSTRRRPSPALPTGLSRWTRPPRRSHSRSATPKRPPRTSRVSGSSDNPTLVLLRTSSSAAATATAR